MKSSEVEEIMDMGSFEKGLRVGLCGRMRSERNKLLAYGLVFAIGMIAGLLISEKRRGE